MPLLLLMMLGTLDLGRMFFDYIQLRNAVREGAAYGARMPDGDIEGRVLRHLDANTRDNGDPIDVSSSTSGSCATIGGECLITVRATRTFRPIFTGFFQEHGIGTIDGTIPLGVSASARVMS